jgi:outer membrane lipoprotein-sorting protein
MEASIERVDFNNLAEDESRERGKIFFARKAAETRIRIDITAPREETILIDKGKLLVFSPKIKQLKERSLEGSQQHDLTEFLLVGFGQSSADIRKLYDPSVKGTEDINGKKTTILELKPKTGSSAAKEITSIVLWLDQNRWVPVRAKITQPSKDSTTVNYLDIKMGPAKDSAFNLEIPPKTKIIPF